MIEVTAQISFFFFFSVYKEIQRSGLVPNVLSEKNCSVEMNRLQFRNHLP